MTTCPASGIPAPAPTPITRYIKVAANRDQQSQIELDKEINTSSQSYHILEGEELEKELLTLLGYLQTSENIHTYVLFPNNSITAHGEDYHLSSINGHRYINDTDQVVYNINNIRLERLLLYMYDYGTKEMVESLKTQLLTLVDKNKQERVMPSLVSGDNISKYGKYIPRVVQRDANVKVSLVPLIEYICKVNMLLSHMKILVKDIYMYTRSNAIESNNHRLNIFNFFGYHDVFSRKLWESLTYLDNYDGISQSLIDDFCDELTYELAQMFHKIDPSLRSIPVEKLSKMITVATADVCIKKYYDTPNSPSGLLGILCRRGSTVLSYLIGSRGINSQTERIARNYYAKKNRPYDIFNFSDYIAYTKTAYRRHLKGSIQYDLSTELSKAVVSLFQKPIFAKHSNIADIATHEMFSSFTNRFTTFKIDWDINHLPGKPFTGYYKLSDIIDKELKSLYSVSNIDDIFSRVGINGGLGVLYSDDEPILFMLLLNEIYYTMFNKHISLDIYNVATATFDTRRAEIISNTDNIPRAALIPGENYYDGSEYYSLYEHHYNINYAAEHPSGRVYCSSNISSDAWVGGEVSMNNSLSYAPWLPDDLTVHRPCEATLFTDISPAGTPIYSVVDATSCPTGYMKEDINNHMSYINLIPFISREKPLDNKVALGSFLGYQTISTPISSINELEYAISYYQGLLNNTSIILDLYIKWRNDTEEIKDNLKFIDRCNLLKQLTDKYGSDEYVNKIRDSIVGDLSSITPNIY